MIDPMGMMTYERHTYCVRIIVEAYSLFIQKLYRVCMVCMVAQGQRCENIGQLQLTLQVHQDIKLFFGNSQLAVANIKAVQQQQYRQNINESDNDSCSKFIENRCDLSALWPEEGILKWSGQEVGVVRVRSTLYHK